MKHVKSFSLLLSLACVLAASGCGKTDPPRFRLNMVTMVDQGISEKQRQTIATVLESLFGTPDEPFVLADTKLDLKKLQLAAGPVSSDKQGKQHGLYRQHCVHCHGTSGDGMGPTAAILNPYPRDYRQGKFKFKSTATAARPTHADLQRIIRQGVAGTAMPSFDLLRDDEIEALAEYVKYLSIRGEAETKLAAAIVDLGVGEELALDRPTLVEGILTPVVSGWEQAASLVIAPPQRPELAHEESVAKGRELFYGNKAQCVKCHGPSELGDGQTNDYDDWNKFIFEMKKQIPAAAQDLADRPATIAQQKKEIQADAKLSAEEKAEKLKEFDEQLARLPDERTKLAEKIHVIEHDTLPVRTIQPRNLRLGVYRGGRRPLDIYRRINAGIFGSPMPAGASLTPEETWNLVDYVRSLPQENISRPPAQHAPVRARL